MKVPILGFFEELITTEEPIKCLGVRIVEFEPGRKLGADGMRTITITKDVELQRGHKTATFKASPEKPLVVKTMVQMLNGRALSESAEISGPYYSTLNAQVYNLPGYVR
jgi:hypothetical protein